MHFYFGSEFSEMTEFENGKNSLPVLENSGSQRHKQYGETSNSKPSSLKYAGSSNSPVKKILITFYRYCPAKKEVGREGYHSNRFDFLHHRWYFFWTLKGLIFWFK